MNFLNAQIGSAKDNLKSPIHNWYKFSAGFSHQFVEQIIKKERLEPSKGSVIFDPFAGCGTTLVCSQKIGLKAIGNEGQAFMHSIIRAKLRWHINEEQFEKVLAIIRSYVASNRKNFDCLTQTHGLLRSLYKEDALSELYLILPHSERDRTENRRPPDGVWLSERTCESWRTGRESHRPRKAFYPSKANEAAHNGAQHF